jgi:hypothetical protein
MRRVLLSAGGVFVALVLGALAFAFVFITYPDPMTMLLDRAGDIRASILARGFSSQHEAWLRVLLDDRQLVRLHGGDAGRAVDPALPSDAPVGTPSLAAGDRGRSFGRDLAALSPIDADLG